MRALVLALGLTGALTACSDPVHDAKRELAIVEKSNDATAICDATRKLANAYLKAQDETSYRQTKVQADVACGAPSEPGTAAPDNVATNVTN